MIALINVETNTVTSLHVTTRDAARRWGSEMLAAQLFQKQLPQMAIVELHTIRHTGSIAHPGEFTVLRKSHPLIHAEKSAAMPL